MKKTSFLSLTGVFLFIVNGFSQTWDYRYDISNHLQTQHTTSNSVMEDPISGTGDYYMASNENATGSFNIARVATYSGNATTSSTRNFSVSGHTVSAFSLIPDALGNTFITGEHDGNSFFMAHVQNSTGSVLDATRLNLPGFSTGVDAVNIGNSQFMAVGYHSSGQNTAYPVAVIYDNNMVIQNVYTYSMPRIGVHIVTQAITNSNGEILIVGMSKEMVGGVVVTSGELFVMKLDNTGSPVGNVHYYFMGPTCVNPTITEIGSSDEYLVAYSLTRSTSIVGTKLNSALIPMWSKNYDLTSIGQTNATALQIMSWPTSPEITIGFTGPRTGAWGNGTGLLEMDINGNPIFPDTEFYVNPGSNQLTGVSALQTSNTGNVGVVLATTGYTSSTGKGSVQLINERRGATSSCEFVPGLVPQHSLNYTIFDGPALRNSNTNVSSVSLTSTVVSGDQYNCSGTHLGGFKKSPTSIEGMTENAFSISPTIGNTFRVSGIEEDVKQIELVSLSGQVMQIIAPKSSELLLELSNLEAGIYFVKVTSDSGVDTHKIIKE